MQSSTNTSTVGVWVSAFRLRTLPLALASIGMGSFLAAAAGRFNLAVFALCALTTVFLQILSNLANDYGDSVHGADHAGRSGPQRAVQSGRVSAAAMRNAVALFAGLALATGIALLYVALRSRRFSGWGCCPLRPPLRTRRAKNLTDTPASAMCRC